MSAPRDPFFFVWPVGEFMPASVTDQRTGKRYRLIEVDAEGRFVDPALAAADGLRFRLFMEWVALSVAATTAANQETPT